MISRFFLIGGKCRLFYAARTFKKNEMKIGLKYVYFRIYNKYVQFASVLANSAVLSYDEIHKVRPWK